MAYRRGFRFVDNLVMCRIEVKQLDYDLTPVGGLALGGHYLKALTPQWAKLDGVLPVRGGVSNSDVLRSYPTACARRRAALARYHRLSVFMSRRP